MNFREIDLKNRESITKAIEIFYSFRKRFGAQAVGTLAQELFIQIVNKNSNVFAKDISKIVERYGREEDIAISKNELSLEDFSFETMDNFFNVSMKTAAGAEKTGGGYNSILPQITTNYYLRETLESFGENDIIDEKLKECLNSKVFNELREKRIAFFLFKEKTKEYGLFYFDCDTLFNNTKYINYRQNRTHATYYFKDSEDKDIAKILYGKNQANAFQRGMWIPYSNNTKNYFSPIIDWTKFDLIDFNFKFFAEDYGN